jgi:hypothetical protein
MTAGQNQSDARQSSTTVPVPDPTLLTTQQLIREMASLRELLETRLDGMDKAIMLIQAQADRIPSSTDIALQRLQELLDNKLANVQAQFDARDRAVDRAVTTALEAQKATMLLQNSSLNESVSRLQELHNEKFESIATQFRERDVRTEQASKDSKVAIDAALQAQKEAVGKQNEANSAAISKSEAAFVKQIDQIGILISTMTKGTDDKIGDIKDRLTTIEGLKKGASELWIVLVGAIGIIISVITVGFLIAFKR